MMPIIRLAAAVAALGLFSSIPAAGQAKLSTQQLNSPTLNGNKPINSPTLNGNKLIAAPNKPIAVLSPNGNKLIAAPKSSGTIALRRPVPTHDIKTRAYREGDAYATGVGANLPNIGGPLPGSQTDLGLPPQPIATLSRWDASIPNGLLLDLTTTGTDLD